MGLIVYYDGALRLKLPPLLVGLKGKIYPLENLIVGKIKGYVDPLELESIYSRRDKALGFTSFFMTTVSILGATTIILLIIVGETILITVPLVILLYIQLYLYKWARSIEVDYWVREKNGMYSVGISVKAPLGTRILIVNQPPLGEIYGSTKTSGEGSVKLEYYWKPIINGQYSWKPQLVMVEEANGLLRLDFSKKIVFNLSIDNIVETQAGDKTVKDEEGTPENVVFYGTIREPEVIGVREYTVGDRLKDIVAKSLLKPGGPRVRKYKELLEGLVGGKNISNIKVGFVLGRLALLSKSYRERILAVISRVSDRMGADVLVFLDRDGILYAVDKEVVFKGIDESVSV